MGTRLVFLKTLDLQHLPVLFLTYFLSTSLHYYLYLLSIFTYHPGIYWILDTITPHNIDTSHVILLASTIETELRPVFIE